MMPVGLAEQQQQQQQPWIEGHADEERLEHYTEVQLKQIARTSLESPQWQEPTENP